ncbi:MAG TPA: DUF4339 domain-containing protein [Hyphomicrobiales bacterium]|nr:DUF4339 domain-containing protein [Hyphomicrobiales bacterium]
MAERQWYWVSAEGQQGPIADDAFRALIAAGRIGRETLVWHAGLPDWQRAGALADLWPDAPPPLPRPPAAPGPEDVRGRFVERIGVWGLFGRAILYYLGIVFVIPAPWTANAILHWIVSKIEVPGRPNLAFTGRAEDIWWIWMLYAACAYAGLSHVLVLPVFVLQALFNWLILRWIIRSLSSNGTPLPLRFAGSGWAYIGWTLLSIVSIVSIIGWAWVATAFGRWVCRHIEGTTRVVTFEATGWQVLWRSIVYAISICLIIPIPWSSRWFAGWIVTQFAVGEPIRQAALPSGAGPAALPA